MFACAVILMDAIDVYYMQLLLYCINFTEFDFLMHLSYIVVYSTQYVAFILLHLYPLILF